MQEKIKDINHTEILNLNEKNKLLTEEKKNEIEEISKIYEEKINYLAEYFSTQMQNDERYISELRKEKDKLNEEVKKVSNENNYLYVTCENFKEDWKKFEMYREILQQEIFSSGSNIDNSKIIKVIKIFQNKDFYFMIFIL